MILLSYLNLVFKETYNNNQYSSIIKTRLCGFVGNFEKNDINFNDPMNQFCTMVWQFYTDILQGEYLPAGKNLSSKRDFRKNSQEDFFTSLSQETPIYAEVWTLRFRRRCIKNNGKIWDENTSFVTFMMRL